MNIPKESAHHQEHDSARELDRLSATNIAAITESFIGESLDKDLFDSRQAAEQTIAEKSERIAAQHCLTVNMSADGLKHFLTSGRLETAWDVAREKGVEAALGTLSINNKDMSGNYDERRRTAEAGLQKYAPPQVLRHTPIYAALASPSDLKRGAAPEYGNYWIELDEAVQKRSIYTFSDSLSGVSVSEGSMTFDEGMILNEHDAITAKSIVDTTRRHNQSLGLSPAFGIAINVDFSRVMTVAGCRPGYIEAAIFDEVRSDDVRIGVALDDIDNLKEAGTLFATFPELSTKAKLYCGPSVDRMAVNWLAQHCEEVYDEKSDETPNQSEIWQHIGLTPTAPYEQIAKALEQRTKELYSDIKLWDLSLPYEYSTTYVDRGQWDRHIKSFKGIARNVSAETRKTIDDFVALQQARVFFSA